MASARQRGRRLERQRRRRRRRCPHDRSTLIVTVAAVDGGSDASGIAASNVVCPQPGVRDTCSRAAATTTVAVAGSSVAKRTAAHGPAASTVRPPSTGGGISARRRRRSRPARRRPRIRRRRKRSCPAPIATWQLAPAASRPVSGGAIADAAVARDRLRAAPMPTSQIRSRLRPPDDRRGEAHHHRREVQRHVGRTRDVGSSRQRAARPRRRPGSPTPESGSNRSAARTPPATSEGPQEREASTHARVVGHGRAGCCGVAPDCLRGRSSRDDGRGSRPRLGVAPTARAARAHGAGAASSCPPTSTRRPRPGERAGRLRPAHRRRQVRRGGRRRRRQRSGPGPAPWSGADTIVIADRRHHGQAGRRGRRPADAGPAGRAPARRDDRLPDSLPRQDGSSARSRPRSPFRALQPGELDAYVASGEWRARPAATRSRGSRAPSSPSCAARTRTSSGCRWPSCWPTCRRWRPCPRYPPPGFGSNR